MGKTSVLNGLKKCDKLRKFPKLGEKLNNGQQVELNEMHNILEIKQNPIDK